MANNVEQQVEITRTEVGLKDDEGQAIAELVLVTDKATRLLVAAKVIGADAGAGAGPEVSPMQ